MIYVKLLLYYGDHGIETGIKPALNYILENETKYNKILIVGHSLGGDNAVVLSKYLNNHYIDVDLLVTLDIKSWFEDNDVNNNVKNAINYHQTNGKLDGKYSIKTPFTKGELLEPASFNNTSNIQNIELKTFNGVNIEHKNIDNQLVDHIYNELIINGPYLNN